MTPTRTLGLLAALTVTLALLPACSTSTFVDTDRARHLAALPYPDDAERAPDRDILVQRDGGQIRIINRSAQPFDNVQLWVNRQYVAELDRIDIGTDNRVSLRGLVNRFQEAFPTAGPLTPDRTEPVTSAELYDPATGQRHRLTVMPEHREQLGER
ncbi:MAG: hypothetical protein WD534_05740 [Phycisphaeraceae bacterium]